MNSQVEKAIKVLQKIKPESTQDLIEKKPNIWVQFTVKKMNDKQKIKPILIPLSEPLQEYNICLFTKDPQHDYKQYASNNVKVMGITKLKQKYATFEQKRLLLKSYDLFLCDSRIVEFMPKLLGKHFFAKKKHPIVIDFLKNVESQIENVKNSTVLHLTKGVSTICKAGNVDLELDLLSENVMQIIDKSVLKLGGWENIHSIHLKTESSTALPIYNCPLEIVATTEPITKIDEKKDTVLIKGKVVKKTSKPKKAK